MYGIRNRRGRSLFAALAFAAAVAVPAATADVGDVAPQTCIQDNEADPLDCAVVAPALNGSHGVTEWHSTVYTASSLDNAFVRFDRDVDTGLLSFRQCFEIGAEDCGGRAVTGLRGASSILVPADGHSLYVTSASDDAVIAFDRSLSGRLDEIGCIEDDEDRIGCADSAKALRGASDIAATERSVWVVSKIDDAVQHFKRSRSTSVLTPKDCIRDELSRTDCDDRSHGLNEATGVAVSPSRGTLYVASGGTEDALVTIPVNTKTGELSKGHCINAQANNGCIGAAPGLDGASSVISPDNRSVYVAGTSDDAIVHFDRDTATGRLTFLECIENSSPDICSSSTVGLDAPRDLAVSPDGRSLYAVTEGDNSLVHFSRNLDTGELTPKGCVNAVASSDECAQSTVGLRDASAVTVSLDGRSVYVTGDDDDSVVSFIREPVSGRISPIG